MYAFLLIVLPLIICLSPYINDFFRGTVTVTWLDIRDICSVFAFFLGIIVFSWVQHISYPLLVTIILFFLNIQDTIGFYRDDVQQKGSS